MTFLRIKNKLRSVLVLDDDPETLRTLQQVLPEDTWRVEGAADRHTAASMLREHQSDVVLLNLDVARSERLDLLWLMRQVRPRARIILITPAGTPADVIKAIREHVFSYFSKPLAGEQLKAMIERAAAATDWEDGIEIVSAHPGWISLRLRCRQLTADRLLQFFRELDAPIAGSDRVNIAIAFRELLLRAIEHNRQFDPNRSVLVSCFKTARALIYLIQDPVLSFDVDHRQMIDRNESVPFRDLGVLDTQRIADEVLFSDKGGEVLLIKYISMSDENPIASRIRP